MTSAHPTRFDTHSPSFIHAVTQLARQQPVWALQIIQNTHGTTLVDAQAPVGENLHTLLADHALVMPLEDCLTLADLVNADSLGQAAENALLQLPFFSAMAPNPAALSGLVKSIKTVPLPHAVAFQLTLARETRAADFKHAILMALLCAYLARESNADDDVETRMGVAASAGLLHDLGMLHISPELLQPAKRLSGEERKPLYLHPVRSARFAERFQVYSEPVQRAILEHHEQLDGSGYPRGLIGSAISPLGQLLSLAEVVTAMFNGIRQYPEQRVALMLRVSPRRFNSAAVAAIQRLLEAVPKPQQAPGLAVVESVQRLQLLAGLLTQWHDALDQSTPLLGGDNQAVLRSIAEQAKTLQGILYESGFTADQLGMLTLDAETDPALQVQLWALSQELQWHLLASANQLQRRWQNNHSAEPIPEVLLAWLDTFKALVPLE
jgi:hypothetical protein